MVAAPAGRTLAADGEPAREAAATDGDAVAVDPIGAAKAAVPPDGYMGSVSFAIRQGRACGAEGYGIAPAGKCAGGAAIGVLRARGWADL